MRSFLFAAVLPLCSAYITTTWRDLQAGDYTFAKYVEEYGKSYAGDEYQRREALFAAELAKVMAHNNGEHGYKLGVNQFSDWTAEEFKTMRGKPRSPTKPRGNVPSLSLTELPNEVDWRKKNVLTPVKNQAACGSCWAFSTTETVEAHLAIATGKVVPLSEQQLVSCMPNPRKCGGTGGCQGATQPLGFNYTKHVGLSAESEYPYRSSLGITHACDHSKIKPVAQVDDYVVLPTNNYTALINAVATVGPIAISVAADSWQSYEGGIYAPRNCGYVVDHAVQLVGYGADGDRLYWIVRNSWGQSWGERGYMRLLRRGEGKEECGMDNKPQDGMACEGENDPIKYCGVCGVLSVSSYPTGARLL